MITEPTLDEELENMTCPFCHGNETYFCILDSCPESNYWFCENCNNSWGEE